MAIYSSKLVWLFLITTTTTIMMILGEGSGIQGGDFEKGDDFWWIYDDTVYPFCNGSCLGVKPTSGYRYLELQGLPSIPRVQTSLPIFPLEKVWWQ
jgi:hypothetical protein